MKLPRLLFKSFFLKNAVTYKRKLAIVTSPDLGWLVIRKRWESEFQNYNPIKKHIENFFFISIIKKFSTSLFVSIAGRLAVTEAICEGATDILITTIHNAPLLPKVKGIRYLIYGDVTTIQLARMYTNHEARFIGRFLFQRLKRLAVYDNKFLCMSNWFMHGLEEDTGISSQYTKILRPFIETEKWIPYSAQLPKSQKKILFLGGDFYRKGGEIILELARQKEFENCTFHCVTRTFSTPNKNIVLHNNMTGDSPELIELVKSCDVFILPTKADCYSLAALEAASCGLPIIISNVGGISDIVNNNLLGKLISNITVEEFKDALFEYVSDENKLVEHGKNAREHIVKNFSKDEHVSTIKELIGF